MGVFFLQKLTIVDQHCNAY